MKRELDPALVSARLSRLRELYVPESVEDARRRLAAERPPETRSFDELASLRLDELRALCELMNHLPRVGR